MVMRSNFRQVKRGINIAYGELRHRQSSDSLSPGRLSQSCAKRQKVGVFAHMGTSQCRRGSGINPFDCVSMLMEIIYFFVRENALNVGASFDFSQ